MIVQHFPDGKAKPNRGALAQDSHACLPEGFIRSKILWDKLASRCDRGCRYGMRLTGEDARHRYLTSCLIMQAANVCCHVPVHPGSGHTLLWYHGPCVGC